MWWGKTLKMVRNISLDIAKGVLILLVVIGHGFQYAFGSNYGQSGLFFINPIYRAIYMFHMPLFMLISGYLFFYSNQKGFLYVLKTKFKTIIIPYITYVVILFLSSIIFNDVDMGGYRLLVNEFWFLPSLFMNCVIIIIVTYFCKGKTILLLSSLIINIALHFVSKYLPATYVFMFSCFLTGFFYNMYIGKSLTINKPNFLILFCCTLILFVCYYNFHHDIYVYTTGTCIWRDGYISLKHCCIDLQRYVVGVIGSLCFMVYISFYRNLPLKIIDLLCRLGKYSLAIYGLSNLLFYIYRHIYDRALIKVEENYWLPLVLSVFFIVIIYMFLEKCTRYNTLRKLLGIRDL